ncbi:hypothetical protein LZZ85_03455 [Terrimonas sp. NA20]|uniref:T9SS type A sorting domain-containing protein n=1 Tax=Terrimonas ginsenosidimutans TaxID=2908004 RepID=A0ABS9KLY5_9BACT|nr:hypothetical protein [Terrimonas ginsenosidimutans]MCG2613316.1 hypothetical protein [Terrimonas ginsenosidimutans]
MKHLIGLALAGLCSAGSFQACAQTESRTYANFQGGYRTGMYALGLETVFGSIIDPNFATDSDPKTFSSPVIPAGLAGIAAVTQFMGFTTDGTLSTAKHINAGVPVTIKMSLPQSLLGLADAIEVGVYSGLHPVTAGIPPVLGTGAGNAAGYNATSMTKLYGGASLINLLNGAGELELTMTPSQSYEGVYVKLSGELLSLALSMQIYDAYIMESNPIPCASQGNAIDILSGVRGNGVVNLLSATGTVFQPWNTVDQGAGHLNTYATISTGAQVLSEVFETVIFNTKAKAGDSLQLVISDPGSGLLDLNLLAALQLKTYNGPVAGTVIGTAQTGLSLRLLSSSSNRYLLSIPMTTAFDRVEISLGGVANVLSTLRIYDVRRRMATPLVTGNNGTRQADTITVYKGTPLQLIATSTDPVSWYNAGNTWLGDGNTYNIPSVTADGYYTATAIRYGCAQNSSEYRVYVKVIGHLTLPVRELSLTAAKGNERINLYWTAKGEEQVSYYTLQKNTGSSGFVDIANIFAIGNSNEAKYEFPDKSPHTGRNLYRLIIHDLSGAIHYSNTIQLSWGGEDHSDRFRVFPNPATQSSTQYIAGLPAGDYTLQITTANGKMISQSNVNVAQNNSPVSFQTGNLVAGIYWLTAIPINAPGNGKRTTVTIRIQ